ncbi:MAG: 50S ribosomal protein L25 [Phycisphaerales bacterium]|nr:50S ribosomal protein L25 [Phycisphaerales bacterium]
MEIATIKGEKRTVAGKHANERLRRGGHTPGVIYGHNETPEAIAVSSHDLQQALAHMTHVVSLDMGGKKTTYLLKEVQYDHLQRTPLHIDLMRVDPNEKVRVTVPVHTRGEPKGAGAGTSLVMVLADLHIECPLLAIPDAIMVNVSHLEVGHSIHVKELTLPQGVTALHQPDDIVCVLRTLKTEEPTATVAVEGAPAEPEVIGRVAKEKGEGEGKE